MVELIIEEKKYEIPTDWNEITLKWWCGLYNIIKKHTKKEEKEEVPTEEAKEESIEEKQKEMEILKMNKEIFMYLTDVNINTLNKLDLESVNNAVSTVSELLQTYEPKGIDRFEFEGETYLFPKEFLRRNTFGDYIEATQLDATIEMMKHDKFDVLPEQMAILCRRVDEEYDDDAIIDKTEKFKGLTMDIVWEFGFFLTMQSVKLTRTFQMFLGKTEEEVEVAKVEFLQLDSTTDS